MPLTKDDSEGASARALAARHEHDEVEVSTLGRGDTFGELAIVQGGVRQASVVATEVRAPRGGYAILSTPVAKPRPPAGITTPLPRRTPKPCAWAPRSTRTQ